MNLNLHTPLEYVKIDEIPVEINENDEILLWYELNPAQSRNIEPEREQFLGNLSAIGKNMPEKSNIRLFSEVILPAGDYLFAQKRDIVVLNREEWPDLAIEQQKDGLWERQKPGNLLFIRFLYEDNMYVTQVFRPVQK